MRRAGLSALILLSAHVAVSVAHAQAADSPPAADPSVAADTALVPPRLLNVEAVAERLVARYPKRLRRLEIVAHGTYAVFVDASAIPVVFESR